MAESFEREVYEGGFRWNIPRDAQSILGEGIVYVLAAGFGGMAILSLALWWAALLCGVGAAFFLRIALKTWDSNRRGEHYDVVATPTEIRWGFRERPSEQRVVLVRQLVEIRYVGDDDSTFVLRTLSGDEHDVEMVATRHALAQDILRAAKGLYPEVRVLGEEPEGAAAPVSARGSGKKLAWLLMFQCAAGIALHAFYALEGSPGVGFLFTFHYVLAAFTLRGMWTGRDGLLIYAVFFSAPAMVLPCGLLIMTGLASFDGSGSGPAWWWLATAVYDFVIGPWALIWSYRFLSRPVACLPPPPLGVRDADAR